MSGGPWTRDMFADEELDEAGITLTNFMNALSCWLFMRQWPTSVAKAARAFNVAPSIVIEAVNEHHWMFLVGDVSGSPELLMIEHDGE